MIKLTDVCFSYGSIAVLRGVSFELKPGECVSVSGLNGSGKSTLAMLLNGLLLPDRGECVIDGLSTGADPFAARRKVGLVFQDPDDQTVARRVFDDIAFGPVNLGVSDVDDRVSGAMNVIGIEAIAGNDIHTLSGGQKQLVAIAGILAMRPEYVVLDEPTSMLDDEGSAMVREAIAAIIAQGKGVLLISHDPSLHSLADRLLLLKDGMIKSTDEVPAGDLELSELDRLWGRLKYHGISREGPEQSIDATLEALCRLRQKA